MINWVHFFGPCMHATPLARDHSGLQLGSRRQGITTKRGDGAPCRPTLRWGVGVSPGFLCDVTGTLYRIFSVT